MRIAFLTTRVERPSYRFRVEQLLPCFRARGHACETLLLPRSVFARFRLFHGLARFDALFVQQRLLSMPELLYVRRRCPGLIYDVDDAVMYSPDGKWQLRRRGRYRAMARSADLVICGNRYLAERTAEHTGRVLVVPTAVDTDAFHPRARRREWDGVTIGWTGSPATNPYLNAIFPVLARVKGNVRVKVMSGNTDGLDFARLGRVPHTFVRWSPENEVAETATFDIGLMPLPDNRWTRGKCGCKALQYMALGIPAVCSPVGVNADIIEHGRNGFLATSDNEWHAVLTKLVTDPRQREEIGAAGRRRVEEAYSLETQARRVVEAVEQTLVGQVSGLPGGSLAG